MQQMCLFCLAIIKRAMTTKTNMSEGRKRQGSFSHLTSLSFPQLNQTKRNDHSSLSKMYSSDTECATRRTETSIRSLKSTLSSNRYVRGLGSHQDLSKRPLPSSSSPTISELIYNGETFPLLAEFLQIHGRESLIGFCAIVIAIDNLRHDRRQAIYAVRAAYRQYIEDSSISSQWLQNSTRETIREQISQRTFDPFQIFQRAMKDMFQYLKQNFYANFLSSKIWKNYLSKKRMKTLNSSTPKKVNLSISTSTKVSTSTCKSVNQSLDLRTSTSSIKTPLACFIQNKDVPYMIYLNIPVERVTLADIKPRIHYLAGKNFDPQRSECHYYFKRRIDPSELPLMSDGFSSKPTYVYEEIDSDDIQNSVPHLDGTIVCKFDFNN